MVTNKKTFNKMSVQKAHSILSSKLFPKSQQGLKGLMM
jgi:hypothetical protein